MYIAEMESVANSVIAAHEAMNNFYNEPAPMRELASLGTSIPGPALAACMTAALCVKLGNRYGVSNAAQGAATEVLDGISEDRWLHYLDGRLENDRRILYKLDETAPQNRWIELITELEIDPDDIQSKPIRRLIAATNRQDRSQVNQITRSLYKKALGFS